MISSSVSTVPMQAVLRQIYCYGFFNAIQSCLSLIPGLLCCSYFINTKLQLSGTTFLFSASKLCSYCFLCLEPLPLMHHLANSHASFRTKFRSDPSESLLRHLLLKPLAVRSDPPLSRSTPRIKISCFLLLNHKLLQIIVTEIAEISQHIVSLYPAPGQAFMPKQLGS